MKKVSLFSHHSVHKRSRHPQDTFVSRIFNDPYVDWLIMFIVAVLISCILIVLGYWTYTRAKTRLDAPPNPVLQGHGIFNAEILNKTLKEFDGRATERAAIVQGSVRMSDPSL